MKQLGTRAGIAVLWLVHWLPLPLQALLGNALGGLLYWLVAPRRKVALINLQLCFPELSDVQRRRLARAHFRVTTRSFIERGLIWWASEARLRRLIRVEGLSRLQTLLQAGVPVIVVAPHFVGLDAGGSRLAMEQRWVSIYARQKNRLLEHMLLHGRSRFKTPLLLSRQDGVRATVRALREGLPFYYLPDLDYGRRDSIFIPFFGVPAATITGVSRLAKLARAQVLTCVTRILPGGGGYVVTLSEPWADFPTDDVEGDTRRINAWLEEAVRQMPEQYYWVHKRFKTRPVGDKRVY